MTGADNKQGFICFFGLWIRLFFKVDASGKVPSQTNYILTFAHGHLCLRQFLIQQRILKYLILFTFTKACNIRSF